MARPVASPFVAAICVYFFSINAHAADGCEARVRNAVADPGRDETNAARDARRKPCEILSFFSVSEGDKVLELLGAQGYYTEILSGVVGESGKVYHHNNKIVLTLTPPDQLAPIRGRIASGDLANVAWIEAELETLPFDDGALDGVMAALALHDYYWMSAAPETAAFKELFRVLRPGGMLMIIDHAAAPGSKTSAAVDQNGLHRIDEAYLKSALSKAGFIFEKETDTLRNPEDDRMKPFFDPSLWRDQTDRFVILMRKPAEGGDL